MANSKYQSFSYICNTFYLSKKEQERERSETSMTKTSVVLGTV
jgi:hypothetical protein